MIDLSAFEDKLIARFRRELSASLERVKADIGRRLRDSTGSDGDLAGVEAARQIGDDLDRMLRAAFRQADDGMRRLSDALLRELGAALSAQGIDDRLTSAAEDTIRAQIGTALDTLTAEAGATAGALREAVVRMFRESASPDDAIAEIAQGLDGSLGRALTLVDTTMMGLDRGITLEAADPQQFPGALYDGPLDALTRSWCAAHVGRAFTREEIDALENDVGPQPPAVYGGGYNCRHRWVVLDAADLARRR